MPEEVGAPSPFFAGVGDMTARVNDFDWAATSLGAVTAWPTSLRILTQQVLATQFPMFLWAGADLLTIYNDAHRAFLGDQHPAALGTPASLVWGDDWALFEQMVEQARATSQPGHVERVGFRPRRSGPSGNRFVAVSSSPFFDDAGAFCGLFCVTTPQNTGKLLDAATAVPATSTQLGEQLQGSLAGCRISAEMAAAIHAALEKVLGNVSSIVAVNRPHLGCVELFPEGVIHGETKARYSRLSLSAQFPPSRVIRTGTPSFLSNADDHFHEFPLMRPDFLANGFEASATVPLFAFSGETLGSLTLVWPTPVTFDADLKARLVAIGDAIGISLERMLRTEAEHSFAQELQRSLLRLNQVPADVAVAAAYYSSRGFLGGDWYDALTVREGVVALMVGDVEGSGLKAAAAMSQLRSAAAAAALIAPNPGKVMETLDQIAVRSLNAGYATTVFGVLDVRGRSLEYSTAGHPPPVLVTPHGVAHILDQGRRWPLGVERPLSNKTARSDFPPGSLLVMYTDGLIKRSGESLELGVYRLTQALERIWWLPTSLICERLLEELIGDRDTDDVALLAVRTAGARQRAYAHIFPGIVENVPRARHRLDAWLVEQDVRGTDRENFLLAVSEAIGNAVLHGNRNNANHVVTVEAGSDDRCVIASVRDRGGWTEQLDGAVQPRGIGFALMRGLVDKVELKSTPDLTRVVIRLDRKEYAPI